MNNMLVVDNHPIMSESLFSRKRFEVILSNMTEGVFELNLDRNIIYANPKAVLLAGVPEEKLPAMGFLGLFPESDRTKIIQLMDSSDRESNKFAQVLPAMLNGREVSLKIIPIRDNDHRSVIIIVNDVSEQKRIEAQLQQAQKMEFIGILAGAVAHDLNNVLTSVISYPELILMDLPEDNPLKNRIQTIKASGQRAAAIVRDMLTLTRRGVPVSEPVGLNRVISDYVNGPELEKLISLHPDVRIETDLSKTKPNILGSPVHLMQTVMNLISNAAEAMSHGGKILISTKLQKIDHPIKGYGVVPEGKYVVLTVTDTGVGISTADMQRIFEPFYTKKIMGRSGTGLGMAVVWGCVKDHKGFIDIKSTEGEGTEFILYFPVTDKMSAKDKKRLSIEEYMGNGESILIVDDIEEQQEILSSLLTRMGYTPTAVSSGKAAIEFMKENTADLLVLDMMMDPHIDGLETYEKILELHPGQKAVITSGFLETNRVKKAQELGAGQYVSKPYVLEKIGLAIKAELEK